MTPADEGSDNPFQSPQSNTEGLADKSPRPGPLAIFFIVFASVVAVLCTFFCTCYGVGLIGVQLTNDLGMIGVGFAAGAVAAIIVAIVLPILLYRWFRNNSN